MAGTGISVVAGLSCLCQPGSEKALLGQSADTPVCQLEALQVSSQLRRERSPEELRWALALQELEAAHSPWRLYRNPRSRFIWVRHSAASVVIERFSLAPLRLSSTVHIEQALEWCLTAAKAGRWLGPRPKAKARGEDNTWAALAEAVAAEVIEAIPKEGSRVHLLNDLRRRVAQLPGEPGSEALRGWVLELDPLRQRRSYTRRLEVLSWIDRVQPQLGLGPVLLELRARRPRGAAQRLAVAQGMRVRLVPADHAIAQWLDGLDPFNQWVFAVLAAYGLRPHELWHCQEPDGLGWLTIPGEMQTKSARAHFAPPVPAVWLERYRLAEVWAERRSELLERWPVRFEERGGLAIPVNNAALGQYLRKQFTLRGVPRLVAPLADGSGTDWLRPYDLRHAYAIRCATSSECADVDPKEQASWLGHSWEVHQRIYLRWLPPERMLRHKQERRRGCGGLEEAERQELEQLRKQMAAMQKLLGNA